MFTSAFVRVSRRGHNSPIEVRFHRRIHLVQVSNEIIGAFSVTL